MEQRDISIPLLYKHISLIQRLQKYRNVFGALLFYMMTPVITLIALMLGMYTNVAMCHSYNLKSHL